MYTNIAAAIIAGGQSSRMGRNKALLQVRGKPIIERVLERVRPLAEPFMVTNTPDDYAHLGLHMVGDAVPDKGSLGGIYTAVSHSTAEHTLVVPCDMPFLSRGLLEHMISLLAEARYDVIVPTVEGYPQGLHAIYSKGCLPHMRTRIDAHRLKVIGFYDAVRTRTLDENEYAPYADPYTAFFNVNTPEDLATARELAKEAGYDYTDDDI